MSDFLAFGQIIAVWIAVSLALWWMRRRWIRSRQNAQLVHAARATEHVRSAQGVFDIIREPVPLDVPPRETKAYLRAETNALLMRIQGQGAFFDDVNTLRVQIQAAFGVDDHKGLSEILYLRRDLWASSEIVLVEDPAQFGQTFAEEGAFERFHGEAVRTLFKLPDAQADDGEDLIDFRLALGLQEAENFAAELEQVIEAARERDRLPTLAELAAYPVAWLRAIPAIVRNAAAFARAFFAHAMALARSIRESEAVTRGKARIHQMGEDWPQRLSDGFQRASETTRENAQALRRHYDFLAAAHDFRAKYEQLAQRAPDLSERSRQFIVRLELAERSESLRLTSANAAVWAARMALNGAAHAIAFLRNLHADLQETAPWALATAALAPAPVRGRRQPAFRSYQWALAGSGLSEARAMPEPPHYVTAKPAKGKAAQKPASSSRKKVDKSPRSPIQQALKNEGRAESAPQESRAGRRPSGFGRLLSSIAQARPKNTSTTAVSAKADLSETKAMRAAKVAKTEAVKSVKAERPKKKIRAEKPERKLAEAAKAQTAAPRISKKSKEPPKAPSKAEKPVSKLTIKTEPAAPKQPGAIQALAGRLFAAKAKTGKSDEPQVTENGAPPAVVAKKVAVPKPSAPPRIILEKTKAPPVAEIADAAPPVVVNKPKPNAPDVEPPPVEAEAPSAAPAVHAVEPEASIVEAPTVPSRQPSGEVRQKGKLNGSFFSRLFKSNKPAHSDASVAEIRADGELPVLRAEQKTGSLFPDGELADAAIERQPGLMHKLSTLDADAEPAIVDPEPEADDLEVSPEITENRDEDLLSEDTDELGPLTQSLMELQSKMKPSTLQIRAFPWLRG